MKLKDKSRVNRYRKAFLEESTGKSDREVLALIKAMGTNRKEFNRKFAQLVKTY
jgi:hypothetical protein